jgi:hypothetical protein
MDNCEESADGVAREADALALGEPRFEDGCCGGRRRVLGRRGVEAVLSVIGGVAHLGAF